MAIQGFIIIIVLLTMVSFGLLYPFAGFLKARYGDFAYSLVAVALTVVLFILLFCGILLRYFVAMRRMNNPGYALNAARACAREDGNETTFGLVSVYAFGATDPTTMLKGQWDISRKRFEMLIGEPLEVERPVRVFVFGKRNSFDAFFKWAFLFVSDLDGMYVPWSRPTISITTKFPAYRLADAGRITRVLFTYFNLDSHRKSPSPLWLQMGVANWVASGGDEMESARLNRKMLAALSRGDWLRTGDFFHISPRSLTKLARDWQKFDSFTRYSQLTAQSSSFVEFLCCESERLERFRAFLKEPAVKSRTEEVFKRHFGYGLETLLERWRQWVLDRGIALHGPPPPDIRDALTERVIPMVQDRHADQSERIQAILEMGRAGHLLGADTLIDLLGKDDQVPAKEVVWSLESISGLTFGADVARWTDWFSQLHQETASGKDMAQYSWEDRHC
jgi:hypothetical protein